MSVSSTSGFVAFFAVLRKIQAYLFMLRADAQADDQVDNLEQNESADDREHPCNRNSNELVQYLMRVAIQQPCRLRVACSVFTEDRIDRALREYAGEYSANRASGTMHAERIQRVVIAQPILHLYHHEIAERPGEQADQQCSHGR